MQSHLRYGWLCCVVGLGVTGASGARAAASGAAQPSVVRPVPSASLALRALPLHFEENRGQIPGQARFTARGRGYQLSLSDHQASLRLPDLPAPLRMRWLGALPPTKPQGEAKRRATLNYLRGGSPKQWRTGVPTFGKVRYPEVYPGIDLVFHGREGELEYDFVVGPGANPSAIRLSFDGARGVEVSEQGDLVLRLPGGGELRQRRPVLYQDTDQGRKPVAGGYRVTRSGQVTFEVGGYNPDRPLVIDPVLEYSSLWGKAGSDEPQGLTVDARGNLYLLAGVTGEIGKDDLLILKLSPSGDELIVGLILGGMDEDWGRDIAVDADENVYVLASSQSKDREATQDLDEGFPLTGNAFLSGYEVDSYRTVVCKLDPNLDTLLYSSRFYAPNPRALALDGNRNVLITGGGRYIGNTEGTVQPTNGCPDIFGQQPFVAKFDMTRAGAASLVYATYFAGDTCGEGVDIAADAEGNATITGSVEGQMNTTARAPQRLYGGGGFDDAFLAKLSPDGSRLLFATHLGGSSLETASGLALGADGSIYVAGSTYTDFPTTPGSLQPDYRGEADKPSNAFVVKYKPDGSIAYSTYLGGLKSDEARAIAVDAEGNAYVAGYTDSTDFPTLDPIQKQLAGSSDAYVAVLNPTGSALLFSTYLGGKEFDSGYGIGLDTARKTIHLMGGASSPDFPTMKPLPIVGFPADPADRRPFSGDLFLARVSLSGGSSTVPGDANHDGAVSILDVLLVLRASAGLIQLTPAQQQAADLSGDGQVTVLDVLRILRRVAGLG